MKETISIQMSTEQEASEDVVNALAAITDLGARVHGERGLMLELILRKAFDNFQDAVGPDHAKIVRNILPIDV